MMPLTSCLLPYFCFPAVLDPANFYIYQKYGQDKTIIEVLLNIIIEVNIRR